MEEPLNSTFELWKDDPIAKWLKEHNYLEKDMDLIEVLKAMPIEMSKEFIRRMITAQAIGEQDADRVEKLVKLAFRRK